MNRPIPFLIALLTCGCAIAPPELPVRDQAVVTDYVPASSSNPEADLLRQQLAAYQRSNQMLREANEALITQVKELQGTIDDQRSAAIPRASSPQSVQNLQPRPAPVEHAPVVVAQRASAAADQAEREVAELRAAYERTKTKPSPPAVKSAAPTKAPRFDVLYRFSDASRRDEFYELLARKGVSDRAKGTAGNEFFVYVGSFSSETNAMNRVRELERLLNVAGAVIVPRRS